MSDNVYDWISDHREQIIKDSDFGTHVASAIIMFHNMLADDYNQVAFDMLCMAVDEYKELINCDD